eukprot:symbB.v1.2.038628.t1/scaffold6090.1/size20993/1
MGEVKIMGTGFKIPSSDNIVTLYHKSGSLKGDVAGMCNVTSGSLEVLECQLPELDRTHWTSTQFEEALILDVNGQQMTSSGSEIIFTYSRPHTPIVKSVSPSALSFAVTSNVTLSGFNFGLLSRQVKIMFGLRPCIVWEVNQTTIICQLKRSAVVHKPLCTKNAERHGQIGWTFKKDVWLCLS